MKRLAKVRWMGLMVTIPVLVGLLAACAPAAPPTPTPTKPPAATSTAAPAAAPTATTAAATPAPTKPAATPTPAKPTGAPIKVGFINPFSGPLASYGWSQRLAVTLAMEDVNAAGGINGSPLQYVIDDSPNDPKQAVSMVRKQAEQDKVFAIVGPYFSGEMDVAAPLAVELKIPVISGSATKIGIAAANRPYSFQMNIPDDLIQPPAIDALKKLYPNVKKVVIVGDTKTAAIAPMVTDIFPRLLKEKGLEVIGTIAFEPGMTDFSAIVTRIKDMKPDAIALASLFSEGPLIAKELQRQQVKIPVMTDNHPTGGAIVEVGGDAVEGWIMPGEFDHESTDPRLQSYWTRFLQRAEADSNIKPKPKHFVTEGIYYDIVMIITDIMRKRGIKPDTPLQEARDTIMRDLNALKDYPGISSKISVQPTGVAAWAPTAPMIAEKGQYKIIRGIVP